MAYNFERVFQKVEQVNFQFLTQEFMHSNEFNKFLLAMHLLFLIIFLLFKWTDIEFFDATDDTIISRIKGLPNLIINLLKSDKATSEMNGYKKVLIIFTSNLIGMMFSRGTHQQFYSWYSYSFPFLVDAAFDENTIDTQDNKEN